MPPSLLLSGNDDVFKSSPPPSIFPHTHSPTNLTLPNHKKSPISHLDDLDSDQFAFLRMLFVLFIIGIIIAIWLLIKFSYQEKFDSVQRKSSLLQKSQHKSSVNGSTSSSFTKSQPKHNAVYKPLKTFDEIEISDSDESEDELVIKLAG